MASALLFLSSRFIIFVLLVYSHNPKSVGRNQILSAESLFLSLNLDGRVYPSRNCGPCKDNVAVLPPCLKAKATLFVLEVGMSALLLLIQAGDVSLNPGPQTQLFGNNVSGVNSSFVSLASEEESLSEDLFDYLEDHKLDSSSSSDGLNENQLFDIGVGSKGLRFGTWNVNGLSLTKLEQIRLFMLDKHNRPQIDILSINESGLKPKIPDSLYAVQGFDIHRIDRKGSKKKGGVLVYVNKELKHRRRIDLQDPNVEAVWLDVYPFKSNRPLLFCGVYRPPASLKEDDDRLEKCFEHANLLNLETIFAGDFNINYLAKSSYKKTSLDLDHRRNLLQA